MRPNRTLRIIKREERERAAIPASSPAAVPPRPESPEREIKRVVTGWVREHRRVAEEVRHASILLLLGAR